MGKRKKRRSSNIKLERCSWCKHKRILRRKIDTLKQFASFPFVFRVIPSFFIARKQIPANMAAVMIVKATTNY